MTYHDLMNRAVTLVLAPYLLTGVHISDLGTVHLAAQSTAQNVDAQPVTRLGTREGPGAIPGMVHTVVRDDLGQFWVTVNGSALPLLFAPDGTAIGSIGRAGQGPGEFSGRLVALYRGGDTVFIHDTGNGRLNLFDLDGRYIDDWPLVMPSLRDAVVLDSVVVANGVIRTREAIGLPLHRFRFGHGPPASSFGARLALFNGSEQRRLHRFLTVDSDERLWVAHRAQAMLEVWDVPSRALLREYELDRDWMYGVEQAGDIPANRTPQPQVADILVDDTNRVWITALVPEEEYYNGFVWGEGADGTPEWIVEDIHRVLDTVVEVMDVDGNLIASERLDGVFPILLGDGYVASKETYETDGTPFVDVWRLRISNSPQ